ncbi:hypothetical protein C7N43_20985 [Sphingobacteriales bacterium UPWRP_1]|nr:hypothetical protein BVG80_15860 [Sphingobacteriales bacterium TSM_CSM]PSJ75058.1 hypothetical protein C7N43_20985 [Sphingobacteriales bacterium UPWRP_1]
MKKQKLLLILLINAAATLLCYSGMAQPYYYSPHIQSFISTYGCANCHGNSGSSGYSQTTYAGVLNGGTQCPSAVRPYDETGSPYVIKTDCSIPLTCGSSRMPLGNPCSVSAADIAMVRAWIRGGALGDNTYCQSFTGSPLTIGFTGFGGGGFTASPSGTQLSSKVWNFGGFSDFYKPGQSNTGNDFARGTAVPGITTGGIYGCTYTTGNQALWIQPASNDFSAPNGGSVNLQLCNNSGSSITSLVISYDILTYNDQGRSTSFNFFYSTDGSTYNQVSALDYATPAAADALPAIVTTPRNTTLTGLNIPNGALFFLRWFGNDVSGAGSRDEIGLDNISVSLPGTCSITGVSASTAVCNGTGATFNVSFTPNSGSGVYNVINTANNAVLASGSSSPIQVTIANSTGGNININVVDAANASCAGTPVQVTLPDCTPVCSITGVLAGTATCSGTGAVFSVSFTATNGSGLYNVINTATSAVLASGSASPIQVTIANSTGGSISINVRDASNASCAGTPVSVTLPDCTPVCSITGVLAGTATCSATNAVFNVSFTATNGSGLYNVINTANNAVLASGSSSPIQVTITNSTGGNININVVDVANPSCSGTPVLVSLPNCPPPVFCGNGTCDGTETYCTCSADCACIVAAAFVNFDLGGNPVSSAQPIAFCLQDITGETNPANPNYLFVPLWINGASCVTYNLSADEGALFLESGNSLQSTATVANATVVWLRMSQSEIDVSGGTTTVNFSGSGGNCTDSQTITWAGGVVNYGGNVANTCKAPLNIRLFLGGAYNFTANNGTMRTDINSLIPANSPYTAAPWNAPAASAAQIPAFVVDWVLIELRNTANNTLVESRAALLASDGFVYNTQLQQGLTFNAQGTFNIVARHRNHVAVMSAAAINPNGGIVNFTIPANVTNSNSQLIDLGGTGLFGLIPGDLNANGVISYADGNVYLNAGTGSNTYSAADCNMDGSVNGTDFTFMRPYIQQFGITPIRY